MEKIEIKEYNDFKRFVSYFSQIEIIRSLNTNHILEVGIGNSFVSDYLKKFGYNIVTCDIDKDANADFISDIRNLKVNDRSFETTMACEVIEHIPFKDLKKAINECCRVSKRYVIISTPYSSLDFDIVIRSQILSKYLNKFLFRILFRIPFFWRETIFGGEHYWEMGRKNYSLNKIRKEIYHSDFKIIKEFTPVLDTYHYFFIMERIK